MKIAMLGGDGVGPEVAAEAVRVLRAVAGAGRFDAEITEFSWGRAWYLDHGAMMPEDALDQLDQFDAILLGAVGSPLVPDHITLREMLLARSRRGGRLDRGPNRWHQTTVPVSGSLQCSRRYRRSSLYSSRRASSQANSGV